jgi:hypothetical protein
MMEPLWVPVLTLAVTAGQTLSPAAGARVTYYRDVAPVFQKRCQSCHRPGQVAPFALTSYDAAAAWAETIREVVDSRRMPPWHADPRYGTFANDPRLTESERQLVTRWVDAGAPAGDPADAPAPVTFSDAWNIPGPDLVVSMPRPFTVPATGVVEYQIIEIDPGFREDRWVRGAEIRPGNRKVVHHGTVFLKAPGTAGAASPGPMGSYCLVATAPGTPPLLLPDGMAKRVPAGWHFVFVLHYVPAGTIQEDLTRLGLVFADPATVKQEVATKLLWDADLAIPPHTADHRVAHTWEVPDDILLVGLFPHMHLRGKSFRYEASYPDGGTEVLLDVPRYDFGWQNRYDFAEPKRIPAGTVLRCIARYDNSADNPANPDPGVTVHAGPQSWEEMFNGYFEWAPADQALTRPGDRLLRTALLVGVPAGGIYLLIRGRRRAASRSR